MEFRLEVEALITKREALLAANAGMRKQWAGVTDCQGKWTGQVVPLEQNLRLPLHRKVPTVWSVWNDLFHPGMGFNFLYKALEGIVQCPQHFFIICTKRATALKPAMEQVYFQLARNYPGDTLLLPNLMLMVTAENQEQADLRIPHLMSTPARYRGISVEPMLGPVDLKGCGWLERLDWVVVGAESGSGKRYVPWASIHALVNQCTAAGVPVFVKQIHTFPRLEVVPLTEAGLGVPVPRFRLSKDMGEWPAGLQRREFPV